jgi:5-methylcytosine-specific restriction enzyme subunit McrC
MNKLFEEFIYEVMRKIDGLTVEAQKTKRLLRRNDGTTRRDTKVDIMVNNKVLDTKYKRFENFEDVSSADIYQVTTYCLLHDTNEAILLYPQWNDKPMEEDFILNLPKNIEANYNLKLASVNLRRDLKNDLQEVQKDLKKILGVNNDRD